MTTFANQLNIIINKSIEALNGEFGIYMFILHFRLNITINAIPEKMFGINILMP